MNSSLNYIAITKKIYSQLFILSIKNMILYFFSFKQGRKDNIEILRTAMKSIILSLKQISKGFSHLSTTMYNHFAGIYKRSERMMRETQNGTMSRMSSFIPYSLMIRSFTSGNRFTISILF